MRVSLTSALLFPLLRFLIHLLLALPLPLLLALPLSLPRLLRFLLLSRRLPLLILSSLLPLALPPFPLRLSGLLLMYQGGVWVLPCLLGFPPLSIMLRSLPLRLLPMLPLGLPLMARMPSRIPYRVLMTLMTVYLMKTTLLSIPSLPLLRWIRLVRNTAAWWNTFAVSFRRRFGFPRWTLRQGLCSSPSLRLLLNPRLPSLSIGSRGYNRRWLTRTPVWLPGLLQAVPTALSFQLVIPLMRFVARMPLAVQYRLTSP